MTPSTVDLLVDAYMQRLFRCAEGIPAGRREELVGEIQEHIAAARAAGSAADEAAVRTLLDRLGEPEEIVAAAAESDGDARQLRPPSGAGVWPVAPARRGTGLELVAVLLMTVGSIIPFVGWLAGAVCLWGSRLWTTKEKVIGTLVVPFGPFGVAYVLGLGVRVESAKLCVSQARPASAAGGAVTQTPVQVTCTGGSSGGGVPTWLGISGFALLLLASVVVPLWLYSRARQRAAALPA